jgi:hypothetical protein
MLFQKPPFDDDARAFHAMAGLSRSLPSYRLDLGTSLADIPPVIRAVLDRTN